tara:strand:+ start:495 stop:725 length:231 start_codon:yes stop_codon:yes gene_type:complete
MTNKINLVINLSILALLIYLASSLNNLRNDFSILTQSLDKVTTSKTLAKDNDDQRLENLVKEILIQKIEEAKSAKN